MKRENFTSRIGFILVSAGCAIGIGNVWKFPYVCGQNGGGIFVLFYLIFLVIMGIPALTMELSIGRASGKSMVLAYKTLEPKGSKWHIHGWICFIGSALLMSYYTTVSGWMLNYMVKFAMGTFVHTDKEAVSDVFNSMISSPGQMLFFMAITVIVGTVVCIMGLQNGIERITKVMMTGLILLIVVLAINSLSLGGAGEGLKFYLLPDISKVEDAGLGNVILAALNQSFFTLSIGIASMEIFGSYMSRDFSLTGESVRITLLDTFIALMAGLIIFPACFSYGVEPGAGPSLIFISLPQVFVDMPGGRIWGTLFFLFMTFASFSTVIAVFENLIAIIMDSFSFDRKKSGLICFAILMISGIPCALGYNLLSGVHLIGARDILDSEDYIVSNLLLPIGALIFALFCTTKYGWGFDKYIEEVNTGKGMKLPGWFKYYLKYIFPILMLIIFISGIIN
ncbi:MAG: sodium-dependent transporter [Lachnospiraceae bacterium]|nr:sodium-dependent transporter [Lachnospiraceae bacterium]